MYGFADFVYKQLKKTVIWQSCLQMFVIFLMHARDVMHFACAILGFVCEVWKNEV